MLTVWLVYILIAVLVSLVAMFEPDYRSDYRYVYVGGDSGFDEFLAPLVENRNSGNGSCREPTEKVEPVTEKCKPTCVWKCDQPEVQQVCKPCAKVPNCSVKCDDLGDASCKVVCEKPECRVVCPETAERCDKNPCKLECKKPVCRVQCKKPEANCRVECDPLEYMWKCQKPKNCPKPNCRWECDS